MQKPLKSFPLFKSVDQALSKVYEVIATSGVKTATYGVPTAASSSTDKLSRMDRLTEAVWVTNVVDETLNVPQRAWVTCTYEGACASRHAAIETLSELNSGIHANPDLVRALVIRHFEFGETFCKSTVQIGKDTGVPQKTVWRADQKVMRALEALGSDVEAALRVAFEPRGWLAPRAKQAA